MKGLFVTAPGHLEILELPLPKPGPFEALVKTEACAICNSTDTKVIHGKFVSGSWPVLLGHESVGRIVKVGDKVRTYRAGDLVLRGSLSDDHIPFSDGRSCWGGFAEFNLVTDVWSQTGQAYSSWPHPQQIVPELIDPVHATALITLKENLSVINHFDVVGKSVAIVGTGPVGQAMALFSRLSGAKKVIVFGRSQQWSDRFEKLGVDEYVAGDVLPNQVQAILKEGGFDRVFEAVGSAAALSRCIVLAGRRGKVGIYGIPPEDEPYHDKDKNNPIVSTPAVAEGEVHAAIIAMVEKEQVQLADWVSRSIPFEDYEEGFRLVWAREANKVVLTF